MRVSVCGLGAMGKNHLRVCNKLGHLIVSTYDPLNDDDYNKFLSSLSGADALIVSSPTRFHTRNIVDALNSNQDLKILCEKPISFSSKDPLISSLLPFQKNILVGQVERFNPVLRALKSTLESSQERIIQIKTLRVNNVPSRETIDVRKDIGIHDLDAVVYLLGEYPDEIDIMSSGAVNFRDHENLFYTVGKVQVSNEISWRYPIKNRTICVLTEVGLYEAHYYNQTIDFTDWSGKKTQLEVIKSEPLQAEVEYLNKMFVDDVPSCILAEENIRLLELLGY